MFIRRSDILKLLHLWIYVGITHNIKFKVLYSCELYIEDVMGWLNGQSNPSLKEWKGKERLGLG